MWRVAVVLTCCVGLSHTSWAEPTAPGTLMSDDTWRFRSTGNLAVDAGLVVGFPAALPTGLSEGIGAGVSMTAAPWLAWGARAAWVTATESSVPWTVTHGDLRLRVTGAVQKAAGRGTLGLRLGLGGTMVHESRVRNQGMRAGLSGSELETSSFAMLPAADLDAVIGLHVAGPWLLMMSAGPSVDVLASKLHAGWSAQLGVAWQP